MIVLHCQAGPAIGLGHLSRCATLCAALANAGAEPVLIVEAADAYPDLERRAGCDVVRAPDRVEAIRRRDTLAPRSRALVTDLLGLTQADSDQARAAGLARLVHLNDSGIGDYRPDLVVDGDLVPQVDAARAGCPVLAGPAWHMIRPDVSALRPAEPWQGARAARVLLTLGGADPGCAAEALLDGLATAGWLRGLTVAVGAAVSAARCADMMERHGAQADVIAAPQDLGGLVLEHDLVVTLGGLTSYEAMCLGRPVGCIAWSHMAAYVDRMATDGFVADLGPAEDAAEALCAMAEDGVRLQALAAAGWRAVDGQGSARVAAQIARLAGADA